MTDGFREGLPSPWPGSVGSAVLRMRPEDFRVSEVPLVSPSGVGEHFMVHLRKRNLTTPEAARALAEAFDVPPGRVSYAGLKDRRAVADQWFSVHRPGGSVIPEISVLPPGLEMLHMARHGRKLRIGTLAGNDFELRLRGVAVDRCALDRRLGEVLRRGVPNYFGPQRFGRYGDNVQQALAMFRGEHRVRNRKVRGLLLSAVRSELFNRVLAARVRAGNWDRPLKEDWLMLDGRRSGFDASTEPIQSLAERVARGEIHPTGPLPGLSKTEESVRAAIEAETLTAAPELMTGLNEAGLKADRRALRLFVRRLRWWEPEPGSLVIGMRLPPGAYATTVLGQIFRLTEAVAAQA